MVVFEQVIEELNSFSVEQRLTLLEKLSASLKDEILSMKNTEAGANSLLETASTRQDLMPLEELYGIMAPVDRPPYTDEEVDEIKYQYILEKYERSR